MPVRAMDRAAVDHQPSGFRPTCKLLPTPRSIRFAFRGKDRLATDTAGALIRRGFLHTPAGRLERTGIERVVQHGYVSPLASSGNCLSLSLISRAAAVFMR